MPPDSWLEKESETRWVIPQQQTVTTRAGIITFFVLALIQSHFLAFLRYPPLATDDGIDNPRHHIIHIVVFSCLTNRQSLPQDLLVLGRPAFLKKTCTQTLQEGYIINAKNMFIYIYSKTFTCTQRSHFCVWSRQSFNQCIKIVVYPPISPNSNGFWFQSGSNHSNPWVPLGYPISRPTQIPTSPAPWHLSCAPRAPWCDCLASPWSCGLTRRMCSFMHKSTKSLSIQWYIYAWYYIMYT